MNKPSTPTEMINTDCSSIAADSVTGSLASLKLYGRELLGEGRGESELTVNGVPLETQVAPHTWTHIDHYPPMPGGTIRQ